MSGIAKKSLQKSTDRLIDRVSEIYLATRVKNNRETLLDSLADFFCLFFVVLFFPKKTKDVFILTRHIRQAWYNQAEIKVQYKWLQSQSLKTLHLHYPILQLLIKAIIIYSNISPFLIGSNPPANSG